MRNSENATGSRMPAMDVADDTGTGTRPERPTAPEAEGATAQLVSCGSRLWAGGSPNPERRHAPRSLSPTAEPQRPPEHTYGWRVGTADRAGDALQPVPTGPVASTMRLIAEGERVAQTSRSAVTILAILIASPGRWSRGPAGTVRIW